MGTKGAGGKRKDQKAMQVPEITLGEHIARARRQAGVSQAELSIAVGVSRPTLGKWERDQGEPSVKQFARIIEATGALWLLEVVGLIDPGAISRELLPALAMTG